MSGTYLDRSWLHYITNDTEGFVTRESEVQKNYKGEGCMLWRRLRIESQLPLVELQPSP